MKRKWSMLLAGALTVVMLSGCGGGKSGGNGKTDILIGMPGGDSLTDVRIMDNFKEARKDKYNITTDEGAWGDFTQKVKMQLVANNDVTPVFFTDSAQAMSFGEQGALMDLNDKVTANIDENLYNKALRALTNLNGNLWGVPHATNSIAILYNKDIFDEKGVAYPTENWTWQEMLDMAKKLTFDRNGDGKTDVYGIYYSNNITQGWYPFMLAYGVSPLSEDYRNSNLNDPRIKQAMESYRQPVADGLVPDAAEIAAAGTVESFFAEGNLAMIIAQASSLPVINSFNADLNYDAQIMPIGWNGERTCVYVPNVWVIAEAAPEAQKEAAWDWLQYYLGEESQMMIAETTLAGYPIMKSALEAVTNNGVKPAGKDAFYRGIDEFGTTIMENPCSTDVNSVITSMSSKIRAGKETIDGAISNSHKTLQETLDYFYEQKGE